MIIMQTLDAVARKKHIQESGLGEVIFEHMAAYGESVCIQYHPKGFAGGVIPELDSHIITPLNPDPLGEPFSLWHACGPDSTHARYSAIMRRNSDLRLLGVSLRVKAGGDVQDAGKQWEETFGVTWAMTGDRAVVKFTNAEMSFVPLKAAADVEGITEITIGVLGQARLSEILWRAAHEDLLVNKTPGSNIVHMLGINWRFHLLDSEIGFTSVASRL